MSLSLDISAYLEHALAGLTDVSDVGPAVGGLLAAARGLLAADSAYLLRRQGNQLVLMAHDGEPAPLEEDVSVVDAGGPWRGAPEVRAVLTGSTVIDRATDSPFAGRPELALVVAPIQLRGEIVGAIAATRPGLFVPSEVRWLRILAQIAGIALENARLLEAERRRARYGETVGALATIERVEVGPFCQRMAAVVNDVMDADVTDVLLSRAALPAEAGQAGARQDGRNELMRLGAASRDPSLRTGLDRIDVALGGAFAASYSTGVPYRCADALENPKAPSMLRAIGMRSILAVPIPGDLWPQGLLIVASHRPAAFDADDAGFLRLIAERVGLLLRHAEVERERARTAARQEFLTVVSHELKTPVAVIKAYAEVLARRAELAAWPERERKIVARVQEQADRMLAMIEQLLDLRRLERGMLHLEMGRFDLAALVRRSVEAIQATTSRHRIEAHAPTELIVRADRRRIEEVVTNLLENAVKYSPAGGRIEVRLDAEPDGSALLSVADEGVGIASEELERIFQRFYQVGAGTFSRGHVGLGLGLYIAQEIVERHGGRIWATSAPGRGSTFYVRLPLKSEEEPHGWMGNA
ncbi:MAG TPA: ATP-binding protein [Chloroflexota bacterium]|jgi:signal transduction histidine kinase|nr:ATP-binding protein [Chloroflexota bacterium]